MQMLSPELARKLVEAAKDSRIETLLVVALTTPRAPAARRASGARMSAPYPTTFV